MRIEMILEADRRADCKQENSADVEVNILMIFHLLLYPNNCFLF